MPFSEPGNPLRVTSDKLGSRAHRGSIDTQMQPPRFGGPTTLASKSRS